MLLNVHLLTHTQPDNDISAYTYERTLIMEQRNEMLKQMRLNTLQQSASTTQLYSWKRDPISSQTEF